MSQCPYCGRETDCWGMDAGDRREHDLLALSQDVAEAKRAYAEAFLLYRRTAAPTDKQAEAMAELDHGERVLLAQARYEAAKRGA